VFVTFSYVNELAALGVKSTVLLNVWKNPRKKIPVVAVSQLTISAFTFNLIDGD
jgi:hypothetical protein